MSGFRAHGKHRAILTAPALRAFGEAPCLMVGDDVVSYRQVADRVEARAHELGSTRRLVMLSGDNDLEFVVTYLAALSAGHPICLLPGSNASHTAELVSVYDPDVVVTTRPTGYVLDERRNGTRHRLHPALALLLSTSGSTGTRKLVRLSGDNVRSNAAAIAEFLQLGAADRAPTSLPLHYCYGLSVLNSHLAVGAAVILTNDSVVDPCFWGQVDHWGATGLAGVPHTFELIERIGVEALQLPTLRYVTQAGGRMAPAMVRRFAELGQRDGWQLVVMYGQTEATARMAYLPPHLALSHPGAIGRPIPGGSIELVPFPALDPAPSTASGEIGEIVYRGPNVMLGYANGPADLAAGREIDELYTGDIGRRNDAGLYEIVGRRQRFLKMYGNRVDLTAVERSLEESGFAAACAGEDGRLVVAVTTGSPPDEITRLLTADLGLPARCIEVCEFDEIPRLGNGKPDYAAISKAPRPPEPSPRLGRLFRFRSRVDPGTDVAAAFAEVLGHPGVASSDTFTSLGGDSLSYIEMSIRLEQALGYVPRDWHVTPVGQLASLPRRHRRWTEIETNVALRAVAILLVVCTHMRLRRLPGGAHTLLAVAGYNFARFQLAADDLPRRLGRAFTTIARVAIPTSLWIGGQMLLVGGYSIGALLLVNNYTGSSWRRDGRWDYWYFEAFVQILAALAILFSIRPVRRLERKAPFAFALVLLGAALLFRFRLLDFGDPYNYLFRPHTVVWFFLLGWCAQRASTRLQRLVVTVALCAAVSGFFGRTQREMTVIALVFLLIWVPRVAVPRLLSTVIGLVASSSMYIFLVHWQVWPVTRWLFIREVAFVVTIAVGVLAWKASELLTDTARTAWTRHRARAKEVSRTSEPAVPTFDPIGVG